MFIHFETPLFSQEMEIRSIQEAIRRLMWLLLGNWLVAEVLKL